jgi:hypothetical protein
MILTMGMKIRHRLTGIEMMVLEVGPQSKNMKVPGLGLVHEEYLAKGIVRVRLSDMKVIDVYEYEIDGMEPEIDTRSLLMEKS